MFPDYASASLDAIAGHKVQGEKPEIARPHGQRPMVNGHLEEQRLH